MKRKIYSFTEYREDHILPVSSLLGEIAFGRNRSNLVISYGRLTQVLLLIGFSLALEGRSVFYWNAKDTVDSVFSDISALEPVVEKKAGITKEEFISLFSGRGRKMTILCKLSPITYEQESIFDEPVQADTYFGSFKGKSLNPLSHDVIIFDPISEFVPFAPMGHETVFKTVRMLTSAFMKKKTTAIFGGQWDESLSESRPSFVRMIGLILQSLEAGERYVRDEEFAGDYLMSVLESRETVNSFCSIYLHRRVDPFVHAQGNNFLVTLKSPCGGVGKINLFSLPFSPEDEGGGFSI